MWKKLEGVANFMIWCHVTVANRARATCPPDITELSAYPQSLLTRETEYDSR